MTFTRCQRCECTLAAGESYLCRDCGEEEDAEVEEAIRREEEMPYCSCPYCMCMVPVEYGGWCDSCLAHAHQG